MKPENRPAALTAQLRELQTDTSSALRLANLPSRAKTNAPSFRFHISGFTFQVFSPIVHRSSFIVLLFAFALPACAQFYWQDNGKSVRQGLHLGWNGAMIATNNDDVALFYYDCRRDGSRDIWGNRLTPAGTRRWGQDGALVTTHISEQRYPVLAAYSDGSTLVVWEDYAPGRYRDLFAQRYNEQGIAMWSPSSGVPVVEYIRDQFEPRVAVDENGYAYIAFTDDRETNGANVRLGAYAQVLDPNGEQIGPAEGIQLVDRLWGANQPYAIAAHNGAAYVLITGHSGGNVDLILQKLSASGSVEWPDDPALLTTRDTPEPVMTKVNGGLAIGWLDRSEDFDGNAHLAVIDYNRNFLSGWPTTGLVIQNGTGSQAVTALLETQNGDIMAAVAGYDFDIDAGTLTVHRYTPHGVAVHTPISFGAAALGASPVDLANDGTNVLVAWTDQFDYNSHSVRVQSLNPTGNRLWGNDGHSLFTREHKEVRCDLVKAANSSAKLAILTGRSIQRPESLWTTSLTTDGYLAAAPELLAGGITYDIFDPRVVRIADERAFWAWTDGRSRAARDLYIQITDGQGTPQLEPQGRAITNGELNLQSAPAIAADGAGGAFVAWIGDSLGLINYLTIQRFDGSGNPLWNDVPRLSSQNGFFGRVFLIKNSDGSLTVVYAYYNAQFISRTAVARIQENGHFSWTPTSRELEGSAVYDMSVAGAVNDGADGVFVSLETGSWDDLEIGLYHLDQYGEPGDGWTRSGRNVGQPNNRDFSPALLTFGDGAILTYLNQNDDLATGKSKAYYYSRNGLSHWGNNPADLLSPQMWMQDQQIVSDGQGGFLLVWEDFRIRDTSRVYAQRFDANGSQLWQVGGVLASTRPSDQRRISAAPDENGGVWLAWEQFSGVDEYPDYDLICTHLNAQGQPADINGFTWPASGYPLCNMPTHQREVILVPWINNSALAVWNDSRSSNPGRCCGAGAVGDIFTNVYGQVLSEISLSTPVENEPISRAFEISAVYPNPFNPETTIEFRLQNSGEVKLSVLNILGQEVQILQSGALVAGTHEATWNAADFPSGIYFAKLQSLDQSAVQKLVLLK